MRILNRRPTVCSFAVCLVLGASSSANAADEKQFSSRFTRFTQKYCTKCHGGGEPEAGFSLEVFKDLSAVIKDAKAIKTATGYVAENTMPPEKNPKPTKAEIDDFVGYINGELDAYYRKKNDPGRVTLRRLNRAEYQNTVRDLFGIDVPVVDNLPQDDTGYGFDTIGDVLTVSPIHLERYLAAAEKVVGIAVVDPKNYRPPVRVIRPESMEGGRMAGTARILATNGEVGARLESLRSGGYSIAVRAFEQSAGTEPAKMAVLVDGKEIARFEVKTGRDLPRDFAVNFENSNSGPRRIAVAFLNDYHDPGNPNPRKRDRNLLVLSIRVEGPLKYDEKDPPESHRRIVFTKPAKPDEHSACSVKIIGSFARRAFRRQVSDQEVARLTRYVDMAIANGDSFERGIQLALQAVLVSPHFLYRVELDPPAPRENNSNPIGEFELATRMSYFLWSTAPDEHLLAAAQSGRLRSNLDVQVRRLLADPKAQAFVEDFAGQWLETRKLAAVSPHRPTYRKYDDELKHAMKTETLMCFAHIMREDRSILEFLDADYTFVNDRLARHYGIDGVEGKEFRRVALKDALRGGVLTQGTFLTITSNPTRTSPVKRGKWVLEQLLGTPAPPPPPNVPELKDNSEERAGATLRQRMEKHRSNAICASCHQRMDPIGFAFENYDGIGSFRAKDGKLAIDASGKLPTGESFDGPAGLKRLILAKKPLFVRCLAEKMLTYALGRGIEDFDKPAIEAIAEKVETGGYRFSSLVLAIVHSEPFQKRRGE